MTCTPRRVATWIGMLMALAPGLAAQHLGLGGGFVRPVGQFLQDSTGAGFITGLVGMSHFEIMPAKSHFGVRFELRYSWNAGNDSISNYHFKSFGAGLAGVYAVTAPATGLFWYLIGGLGLYHVTFGASAHGFTNDVSAERFGWNLGAGIADNGKGHVFVEARYFEMSAFGMHENHVAAVVGMRFPVHMES